MLKSKTHFEQVPLEIVRKMVEAQIRQAATIEQSQEGQKNLRDGFCEHESNQGSRWKLMVDPFDIFQTETVGSLRWVEAAKSLEDAKARVQDLALRSPGEYIILDQKTGNKIAIKSEGVDDAPSNHTRFPAWEKPYQDALKESDPQKRSEKVTAAETAIFQRLRALVNSADGNSEAIAIQDALDALFNLKNEKLHWERLFREVLLEHRPRELYSKIQVAEVAIYMRLQALAHGSSDQSERQVLADAMSTLRILQQGK
jgi:hypothetical protein